MKGMGVAAPVLLVLALVCWLYMLWSIVGWIGKTPDPGQGEARFMQQVPSGVAAGVLWLLLAGLLVVAATKASMPGGVGLACWVLHPLSGLLAVVAIGLMYDAKWSWLVVAPALMPLLIAGYAIALLAVPERSAGTSVGLGMWAAVMLLGLLAVPAGVSFQREHFPASEAVEDKPGPELDAFKARERERLRQQGLEQLRLVDDETRLSELESLAYPDSPVRKEALEAIHKLPKMQADTEIALEYHYMWTLWLLADIAPQATPSLCQKARAYLSAEVQERRRISSEPLDSVGLVLDRGLPGIAWIARNCECSKQLDELEKFAAEQKDSPDVQRFRDALKAMREK